MLFVVLAAVVNVTVGPGLSFSPNPVGINVGDSVQWNWVGAAHSSTSSASSTLEVWDSGVQTTGSFSHTFTHSGTFGYFCTLHGIAMSGSVQVSAPAPAVVPAMSPRALILFGLLLASIGAMVIRR
ncbi:MAG TPA: plastocyanin/azurin family copper-binding protein [Thermoanaerobaculia bacterium]|nr:plastocyanin/azurin family copper-binding protein [Thermoanaerobaculia bacterium]